MPQLLVIVSIVVAIVSDKFAVQTTGSRVFGRYIEVLLYPVLL